MGKNECNIRNELNFSEVHCGMNRSGLLAKVTYSFTLHATNCGSYRHEPPKNEIHFLNRPCTSHIFNIHSNKMSKVLAFLPKIKIFIFTGIFRTH